VQADVTEFERLKSLFMDFKPDWTIHFSANADVRFGTNHPRKDLEQNTLATWNVLESCRLSGCSRLLFSSTGSVYGEPDVFPTPENCPFPTQTSLYGASKVAGEALISAYCYGYGLNAVVFRFVSILGPRYTHGHVFDFVRKLKADPDKLLILGNGAQLKSYLHVLDLMEGIWKVINSNPKSFNVFNIGHDEALNVTESARYIASRMNLTPEFSFTGGERGWIGDSPRIQLNTDKLKSLGWKTRFSLKESLPEEKLLDLNLCQQALPSI
jgi:UDP-glucose 4-epimerase